jgi:hypothetical protein
MDAALMLEAMAIKNDIFEGLRANPEQARDELKFPYQLTQKPGVGELERPAPEPRLTLFQLSYRGQVVTYICAMGRTW